MLPPKPPNSLNLFNTPKLKQYMITLVSFSTPKVIIYNMLFNDTIALELLIGVNTIYYVISIDMLILIYLGGLYLLTLSSYLLTLGGDIYVGFLLVIDLGLGLVLFIFVLHFTTFTSQKPNLYIHNRCYVYLIGCVLFTLLTLKYNTPMSKNNTIYDFFKN